MINNELHMRGISFASRQISVFMYQMSSWVPHNAPQRGLQSDTLLSLLTCCTSHTHTPSRRYKHHAPVKESPATPSRATADQCSGRTFKGTAHLNIRHEMCSQSSFVKLSSNAISGSTKNAALNLLSQLTDVLIQFCSWVLWYRLIMKIILQCCCTVYLI